MNPSLERAGAAAATLFAQTAMRTLATQAAFHAAVCGGEVLAAMLAALARLPAFRRLDWRHVYLFAVDDGWDEAALQALSACPLPPGQLRQPRRNDIARLEAALRYEQVIAAHFALRAGDVPAFDFMLLAADASGRVAGFSRGRDVAADVTRLVVAHPCGAPRVALSLPVLNAAQVLAFVCEGPCTVGAAMLDPRGEFHLLSPSTARSSGAATPATLRAARSALPPA